MQAEQNANIPVIDYKQLKNNEDISAQIEAGFGSKGHGIIFIKNIPEYAKARIQALLQIYKLANLPAHILLKYEKEETSYSRGWSKGKEKFKGHPDDAKASYYINPVTDDVYKIPIGKEDEFSQSQKDYYSQCMNIWPEQLPNLQINFKFLSKIMIDTGVLLARHIDKYAKSKIQTYNANLEGTIKQGTFHFARILHYFPQEESKEQVNEICGWHNDHGALTALTSAMYIDEDGNIVENSPSTGGLYAQNRFTEKARIKIPADMLAFQLGQSTQIYTGGMLEATPHAVKSPDDAKSKKLSRNTFAIFLQADPLGIMRVPQGMDPKDASVIPSENLSPLGNRFTKNGMYFKQFHLNTLNCNVYKG